jgi:hypothetical protein
MTATSELLQFPISPINNLQQSLSPNNFKQFPTKSVFNFKKKEKQSEQKGELSDLIKGHSDFIHALNKRESMLADREKVADERVQQYDKLLKELIKKVRLNEGLKEKLWIRKCSLDVEWQRVDEMRAEVENNLQVLQERE